MVFLNPEISEHDTKTPDPGVIRKTRFLQSQIPTSAKIWNWYISVTTHCMELLDRSIDSYDTRMNKLIYFYLLYFFEKMYLLYKKHFADISRKLPAWPLYRVIKYQGKICNFYCYIIMGKWILFIRNNLLMPAKMEIVMFWDSPLSDTDRSRKRRLVNTSI